MRKAIGDLFYQYFPRFMSMTFYVYPGKDDPIDFDALYKTNFDTFEAEVLEVRFFNFFSFVLWVDHVVVGEVLVSSTHVSTHSRSQPQ